MEAALSSGSSNILENLKAVLGRTEEMLKLLADLVLQDQPPLRRKKLEHLVIIGPSRELFSLSRAAIVDVSIDSTTSLYIARL